MGIDDTLFDAAYEIEDYLAFRQFDEDLEADIVWLLTRMAELRRYLEGIAPDRAQPRFRERFGDGEPS